MFGGGQGGDFFSSPIEGVGLQVSGGSSAAGASAVVHAGNGGAGSEAHPDGAEGGRSEAVAEAGGPSGRVRNVHLHNGGIGGSVDLFSGETAEMDGMTARTLERREAQVVWEGAAFGGAGVGGPGMMPGAPGAVTVGMIGNGGDGGDGEPPGSGGPTGEDKIAPVAIVGRYWYQLHRRRFGCACQSQQRLFATRNSHPKPKPTKQVGQAVLGDSEALCSRRDRPGPRRTY